MKYEKYTQIKKFLIELIKGTEWEDHVFTVGGCVRDELMGSEIKDIDMCVSLPSGGIRFAEWLRDNGHAMKGVTVYPNYHFGTVWEHTIAVMRHLKSDKLELRMAALLHDIGQIRVHIEDGNLFKTIFQDSVLKKFLNAESKIAGSSDTIGKLSVYFSVNCSIFVRYLFVSCSIIYQ